MKVFRVGAAARGLPRRLVCDNVDTPNPTLRGLAGEMVPYADSLGVATTTGKSFKPTVQGKNERVHSTLFTRLKKQPFAKNLAEIQAQIEVFGQAENTHCGHQSLEGR